MRQPGAQLDAVIISAAQKVEHYDMASYGTSVAWAEQIGNDVDEEKEADQKLTQIAESLANAEAEE